MGAEYAVRLGEVQGELAQSSGTTGVLKAQLAEREQRAAEVEAVSSGEVARLSSALEACKGELMRSQQQQEMEREAGEAGVVKARKKLEVSEKTRRLQEAAWADVRSGMEEQLGKLQGLVAAGEAVAASKAEEVARFEGELVAYKARSAALLQRKNAELEAAQDVQQLNAQKAAMEAALEEARDAAADRDRAVRAVEEIRAELEARVGAREGLLLAAEQQVQEGVRRLERAQVAVGEGHARLEEQDLAWQGKHRDSRQWPHATCGLTLQWRDGWQRNATTWSSS